MAPKTKSWVPLETQFIAKGMQRTGAKSLPALARLALAAAAREGTGYLIRDEGGTVARWLYKGLG